MEEKMIRLPCPYCSQELYLVDPFTLMSDRFNHPCPHCGKQYVIQYEDYGVSEDGEEYGDHFWLEAAQ